MAKLTVKEDTRQHNQRSVALVEGLRIWQLASNKKHLQK